MIHMVCRVGDHSLALRLVCDKATIPLTEFFVGTWVAYGVGVELVLKGFNQGACGA